MRRFIRHPSDIPISYSLGRTANFSERLKDVSRGGVCFSSDKPLSTGCKIKIKISLNETPYEAEGNVAWCHPEDDSYSVGVAFNDSSTQFNVRMIEQICHIEHYRYEVLEQEGRKLTSEEAAEEWVAKFAADFPSLDQTQENS